MHKSITAVGLTLLFASTALAATSPDTISVTGKAAPGGTKTKPKAVAASWSNTAAGPDGARAETPAELAWKWTGIKSNGDAYPTCTAADIDAAQSDASCPAKSLVATGHAQALLGADTDKLQNTSCEKDVRIYNAGKGKSTLYLYGPAGTCAGVAYLAPVALTSRQSKTGETVVFTVPDNIGHPLPGLSGAIIDFRIAYKKQTIKKGKKKVPYLASTGCGKAGERTLTYTTSYATFDTVVSTASAGKC